MSGSIKAGVPVNASDFCPWSTWTVDENGPKVGEKPQFIKDQTSGKLYHNESKGSLRWKFFKMNGLGSALISIHFVLKTVLRIIKLATLSHLWMPQEDSKARSLKGRVTAFAADLARVAAAPLALAGMVVMPLYGIINPLDSRKLFATIQRAEDFVTFESFQPQASETEMQPVSAV
jgi:hypothetical protein